MRNARLAALACLLFVGCGDTSSIDRSGSAITGTKSQLSTGDATATQTEPAISGTRVVWTDTTTVSGSSDIWFLDLASTAPARNLTNTPNENEFLEDIDGTNVVWTHQSAPSPGDVVVYDTSTNAAVTVAASSSSIHFEQPAIQGRYVVYQRVTTQADIDGFDNLLGLPFAQPVTNDAALQARPRVWGDLIVYEDYNSGNADIFGYHISTSGPPFAIATRATGETQPDVDGNHVVWVDDNGNTTPTGTDQIMLRDLATDTTRQLTTVASHKLQPRLSGIRLVWSDDRNGNLDVFTYDLTTSTEELLVGGPGDQLLADIDGSRVVYTSNETGFQSIYLFTISAPGPAAELQGLLTLAAAIHGLGTSLPDKLSSTLQDVQSGDDAAACAQLDAFLHEIDAQTGKKITQAQAASMHASACEIKSQLGCACK
jgi:beta propeller repeat protein